jgi:hypothetical protein
LPLARCHSLGATRHEDRSPPHLSLREVIDSIYFVRGSNIAYGLGECIQVLTLTLPRCVLECIT